MPLESQEESFIKTTKIIKETLLYNEKAAWSNINTHVETPKYHVEIPTGPEAHGYHVVIPKSPVALCQAFVKVLPSDSSVGTTRESRKDAKVGTGRVVCLALANRTILF